MGWEVGRRTDDDRVTGTFHVDEVGGSDVVTLTITAVRRLSLKGRLSRVHEPWSDFQMVLMLGPLPQTRISVMAISFLGLHSKPRFGDFGELGSIWGK
jgi:hypothetical protein